MLNKHGISLTENFRRAFQILYLANRWGRISVAYGLTSSQACFNIASSVSASLNMFRDVHFVLCQVAHTGNSPALITKHTCLHVG